MLLQMLLKRFTGSLSLTLPQMTLLSYFFLFPCKARIYNPNWDVSLKAQVQFANLLLLYKLKIMQRSIWLVDGSGVLNINMEMVVLIYLAV